MFILTAVENGLLYFTPRMNLQELNLGAALTGYHELASSGTAIYCDGRNYIPPGLSGLDVDEVYLFQETDSGQQLTGMQYFVAFVQTPQVILLKIRQHTFTLVAVLPGQLVLTEGTAEYTITRTDHPKAGS